MEPDAVCFCGDVLDDHSRSGECEVDGCDCPCFEADDEVT